MLRVGLTGGIATGKSHIASIFRSLGCHTIDADHVARLVVEPCRPAFHEILSIFGRHILTDRGTIDRAQLGAIVFHDPAKLQQLNAIVHPRVIEEIERQLDDFEQIDPDGIVLVDAALIIEAGMQPLFHELIVVFCDEETQVTRVMSRDGISRDEALQRIHTQMSSNEKRKHADLEIDTSGSFEQTRQQADRVFDTLRSQARSAHMSKCQCTT